MQGIGCAFHYTKMLSHDLSVSELPLCLTDGIQRVLTCVRVASVALTCPITHMSIPLAWVLLDGAALPNSIAVCTPAACRAILWCKPDRSLCNCNFAPLHMDISCPCSAAGSVYLDLFAHGQVTPAVQASLGFVAWQSWSITCSCKLATSYLCFVTHVRVPVGW